MTRQAMCTDKFMTGPNATEPYLPRQANMTRETHLSISAQTGHDILCRYWTLFNITDYDHTTREAHSSI